MKKEDIKVLFEGEMIDYSGQEFNIPMYIPVSVLRKDLNYLENHIFGEVTGMTKDCEFEEGMDFVWTEIKRLFSPVLEDDNE